jgi:hypothetical protein
LSAFQVTVVDWPGPITAGEIDTTLTCGVAADDAAKGAAA